MTDTAQLSAFIRGVNFSLCIAEDLLGIKSVNVAQQWEKTFEEVSK